MRPDELLPKVDQIEELLRTGVAGHLDTVERLLLAIARNARNSDAADLAMQALSAASAVKHDSKSALAADRLTEALSRLRARLGVSP